MIVQAAYDLSQEKRLDCIYVRRTGKNGELFEANVFSIMMLVMLTASHGSELEVCTTDKKYINVVDGIVKVIEEYRIHR
jgi:phosphotransferase system HPr-like phosphotransfer protein